MNPAGHLAVGYLLGRRRLSVLIPVWVGTFLPDLVDKPLMLVGVTPYGRTVGHSLVLWATFALLFGLAWARRLPQATALGGLLLGGVGHLLTDLVDDVVAGVERTGYVFSAWAGWPWTNPDMWSVRSPHLLPQDAYATTSLELLTLGVCVVALVRRNRSATPDPHSDAG